MPPLGRRLSGCVGDHDPKFTSDVLKAFVTESRAWARVSAEAHRRLGVPQEHQREGGAGQQRERIGDTLRAFANGCKDDWDRQLPLAVFAINNAASTLGDGLTPFYIDLGAHPRLPLSTSTAGGVGGESPGQYTQRMRELKL